MGIFVIANVILPQSPNFKGLSLPRESSTHCEGCTQGRPLFTKFLARVAVNISISYNWDSFLNEKMRIIFETKKEGAWGHYEFCQIIFIPFPIAFATSSLLSPFSTAGPYRWSFARGWILRRIICKWPDPQDNHLQEAGSSGLPFASGRSKWSIEGGQILWMFICKWPDPPMIICKRPDPPDDHFQQLSELSNISDWRPLSR